LIRGSLGSFIQELFGEIDSDNMSSRTDAFGRWNGGCTHAAANVKNGHAGNERETIDSPPTVAIPEGDRRAIVMIGSSVVGFFQFDLWSARGGHKSAASLIANARP
jgi:hypothetical protein